MSDSMRWPMTVGYLFFAAVIWVFFGYKFAALRRRTPAGRPPLRPVLYSLALVGTAYVATAPEVAAWFDREVGRPNLAPMIGYCLATWWCCSAQAMLFYWRLPAERAWQRTRRRIPVYGLVVCAMVTLWFLGSAPVEHPADFETAYAGAPFITEYLMVFYIALVVSIVLAAFSCWRWSAEVVDPWLRRALLFTAAGLAGGAAYPLGKITVVGLRWANIGDPVTLANWNAIIIPSLVCGISTPLVLIGAIIPRLGPPVARRLKAARNGIVRLPVDTWAYWALTPLHSALCPIEPKLVHQPASLGERLTVRLRLFWRLAEIRDWEWKLRPYVHPHVIPIAERHCASGGVGVDDTWAIVEAAQVKAALAAIRQGARVERDADFPAEPDDVPVRTTLAVATERNRLVKVARAFHRSPIVGAVVAEVLAVAAGPA